MYRYVIDMDALYAGTYEVLSRVAAHAYTEEGASLYDVVIPHSADRSTIDAYEDDALHRIMLRLADMLSVTRAFVGRENGRYYRYNGSDGKRYFCEKTETQVKQDEDGDFFREDMTPVEGEVTVVESHGEYFIQLEIGEDNHVLLEFVEYDRYGIYDILVMDNPDFDEQTSSAADYELTRHITLSAVAEWLKGRYPARTEEWKQRADEALARAVQLIKTRKVPERRF